MMAPRLGRRRRRRHRQRETARNGFGGQQVRMTPSQLHLSRTPIRLPQKGAPLSTFPTDAITCRLDRVARRCQDSGGRGGGGVGARATKPVAGANEGGQARKRADGNAMPREGQMERRQKGTTNEMRREAEKMRGRGRGRGRGRRTKQGRGRKEKATCRGKEERTEARKEVGKEGRSLGRKEGGKDTRRDRQTSKEAETRAKISKEGRQKSQARKKPRRVNPDAC